MSLTIATPKTDNKLSEPFNNLLQCGGFEYQALNKEEGIIVDLTGELPDIKTIVLRTQDAIDDLCDGSIALAPIGGNTLKEFNLASNSLPPLAVAKLTQESSCTFCLAGRLGDNPLENGLNITMGKTIVTSYPNILMNELRRVGIVSSIKTWDGDNPNISGIPREKVATIIVRKGGVEKKAATLKNALVFDLVETGKTLERNGFEISTRLPVMDSSLLFVESRSDKQRRQQSAEEKIILQKFLERIPETTPQASNVRKFALSA